MPTPLDKVIYTAKDHTTGGREGRSVTDDGLLDVKLAPPKEMGGKGGAPSGALAAAIDRDLGGLEAFKGNFNRAGAGVFGSGWVFVTVTKDGKRVKVVVQPTKHAMIWILDAATGKPIHPWEERPVAQSQIPGEKSSPTQPFTISPPPLIPATVKRDDLSQLSAQANAECKALFDERKLEDVGPFSVPKGDGAWALNSIGASIASNKVTAQPRVAGAPSAPSGLAASVSSTTVTGRG